MGKPTTISFRTLERDQHGQLYPVDEAIYTVKKEADPIRALYRRYKRRQRSLAKKKPAGANENTCA